MRATRNGLASSIGSSSGVSMKPGATALTRIPSGATSAPTDFVSPAMACLAAAYSGVATEPP